MKRKVLVECETDLHSKALVATISQKIAEAAGVRFIDAKIVLLNTLGDDYEVIDDDAELVE